MFPFGCPTMLSSGKDIPLIGQAYHGGFFVGQIMDGGVLYNVIAGPKSAEMPAYRWRVATSFAPASASRTNGPLNTSNQVATSTVFEAAVYCAGLVIDGYDDWYFPAIDELELAYRNLKPTTQNNTVGQGANANSIPVGAAYSTTSPAQSALALFQLGGAQAFTDNAYWASNDTSSSQGQTLTFNAGGQTSATKTAGGVYTRPFRREAA